MKAYFILRVLTVKCYQILLPKRIRVDEEKNPFIDIDSSSNDFISIMKCNIRSKFQGKSHSRKYRNISITFFNITFLHILFLNNICDSYNLLRVQYYELLSLLNKNILEEASFLYVQMYVCKFDFEFRKTWSIYIFTLVFHICVGEI